MGDFERRPLYDILPPFGHNIIDHRQYNGLAFGDKVSQCSFGTWQQIKLVFGTFQWSIYTDRRDVVAATQIKPRCKPFIALRLNILFAHVYN